MNLLKIHHQPFFFHIPQTTPPQPKISLKFNTSSSTLIRSISHSKPSFKLSSIPNAEASIVNNQEKEATDVSNSLSEFADLAPDGAVYLQTLRLVECSMFAAVTGLVYFLSNSLSIENYFGCFFLVANSYLFDEMWGIAAGRKTIVCGHHAVACLVWSSESLSLSAYTWSAWFHNGFSVEVGSGLGAFDFLVHHCSARSTGAMRYIWTSSFLIRENILALIAINIHASLTFIFSATGVNIIPSMNVIYAIFGTLVLLNSRFFVFLLHILYYVFLTRLGMKAYLRLPRWLEMAL